MIIKSSKSDESNRKRLESLKQKADEFKQMKKINKMNLSLSLDDQQAKQSVKNQTTSKKIVFNDDDDDDDEDDEEDQKKSTNHFRMNSLKPVPSNKFTSNATLRTNVDQEEKFEKSAKITSKPIEITKKKLKLIDSDSDDDEQKEKDIKLLESKINLNQKQADKLIYLKTKFSNDDKRFKIDDRFIDELGSDEEKRQKIDEKEENMPIKRNTTFERRKDEHNDEERNNPDDDEEDSEVEDISFDLKKEHLSSLKILEEITGRQLVRPVLDEKEPKKLGQKRMIRYDPTYDEHKVYELNDKDSASEDDEIANSKRTKISNKKGESDDVEVEDTSDVKIQDPSQYYQVDENLKDLFSSKDVFKFQFLSEQTEQELNENDNIVEEQHESKQFSAKTLNILEKFNRNKVMLSSDDDDESEVDEDDEDHEQDKNNKNMQQANGHANRKVQTVEAKDEKRNWRNTQLNGTEAGIFFPFKCESGKKQIKEALDFFHQRSKKSMGDLREEWFKQRVLMVQEYKRKHKRVLRIKRTKQNEKMLPWRKKKS